MANHPNRRRRRATARRRTIASGISPASVREQHDHDYSGLLAGVCKAFLHATLHEPRLFLTDAPGLWDVYLDNLPAERQVHTCSECRRFVNRFGSLVTIGADGALTPVMWDADFAPEFYRPAFAALAHHVRTAVVTSVFFCAAEGWGTAITGTWKHIAVTPSRGLLWRRKDLTAGQAMARARENVKTVRLALADYTPALLDEAMRVLASEHLRDSEKFVGPARWLRALHDRPKGRAGEHILWGAVATAPQGFCHPRAGVIGTLLEDIRAGLPFAEIKRRFDAKLNPLEYQRPQAAPSRANIEQAEKLVEQLGITRSLERRFATVDEVVAGAFGHGCAMWQPVGLAPAKPAGSGVFGHLEPKDETAVKPVALPPSVVTWRKFTESVLPHAAEIELLVPHVGRFIALTAPEHWDAPPILKWDHEDARNPFAWYVYPNRSPALQWGLRGGTWVRIEAIVPFPNCWGAKHVTEGAILLLRDALDSNEGGNALFPECVREELHGVRATIEAYSKTARLGGRVIGTAACGYDLRKTEAKCLLRVTGTGAPVSYQVDRWE